MTRRELTTLLTAAAEPVYGAREAAAIARLIAEKRYGLTRADLALEPLAGLDPGDALEEILADLAAARPVQYILGVADFDGMELSVGEDVLIPRPETEELVRWIGRNAGDEHNDADACYSRKTRILDIGTGSGAIAIALAKRLPGAHVTAVDISPEALHYARLNNEKYSAGVELLEADILDFEKSKLPTLPPSAFPSQPVADVRATVGEPRIFDARFNIIVSNPPYIPAAERSQMADNVVRHEPHTALFVPDDDPLLFYRVIAKFARRGLSSQGALYFEIHERAARSVVELLEAEGFHEIELHSDINSKPRMVRALAVNH